MRPLRGRNGVGDLALMAETMRVAKEIGALTDRIDVLLNNAGGIGKEKVVTAEGNEAIFAGNHLGAFLLTREFAADAAAGGRPCSTRRRAHSQRLLARNGTQPRLDWNDLQMLENHVCSDCLLQREDC